MTFGWGLLPRSSSRPKMGSHRTDSMEQLSAAHDYTDVPQRSSSSNRLAERAQEDTPMPSLLQQPPPEGGKAGHSPQPRTSADCVIESARCTSDPSYSNRPSMDFDVPVSPTGCDSLLAAGPHRRRGVDFDASSAPASARASLDADLAAAAAASAGASNRATDSPANSPTYASARGSLDSSPEASSEQATASAAAVLAARAQEAAGRDLRLPNSSSKGSLLCPAPTGASEPLPPSQAYPILTPRSQQLKSHSLDLKPPGAARGSFDEMNLHPAVALPPGNAAGAKSQWGSATPSSCPSGGGLLASTLQREQEESSEAGPGAGTGPRVGPQRPVPHMPSSPFQPMAAQAELPSGIAHSPLVHAPLPRSVVLQHLQMQQQAAQLHHHPPHPAAHHPPHPAAHHPPQPALRTPRATSPPPHLPPVCEGQPATDFPSPVRPHAHAPTQPRRLTAAAALLAALQQEPPGTLGGGIVRSLPVTRAPSAEIHDPMMDVHGTYGCHLMPERQQQEIHSATLADAIQTAVAHLGGGQRSSIDLLLDPLPQPSAARKSMDLLLSAPNPRHSAAASLGGPRLSLDSIGRGEDRHSSVAAGMLQRDTRHSSGAFMTPQCRGPLNLSKATSSFANLEALGMPHAASTNAISDLAGYQELPVPSTPTAATAADLAGTCGSAGGLGVGTTASAYASSVVDTSSGIHHGSGNYEGELGERGESYSGQGGLSQELWLDPDLHDTFGAHAMFPPAPAVLAPPAPGGGASPRGRRGSQGGKHVTFRMGPGSTGRRSLSPPAAASAAATAATAGARPTAMLEPSAVPGQHSVTVSDPQGTVPSLEFLRQRKVARQKLEQYSSRGGYIAEAKRVLSEAMSTADPLETLLVQSSESGAIGPLLRHLSQVKGDDEALRSGLHTLSLIISNSPNRGIIMNFRGQQMLFDILSTTRDLEVQENIIQLLWDLESEAMGAARKDCKPDLKCMDALISLLERTNSASIASHVIHFMHSFTHLPCPGDLLADAARRLVAVVGAYRYHLQDAAQYTLGLLLTAMLEDPGMKQPAVGAVAEGLIQLLLRPKHNMQCQAVLTLLSCVASGQRFRDALCRLQARAKLLQFGQHVADARLRARALSLVKVLNKQELRAGAGVAGAHLTSRALPGGAAPAPAGAVAAAGLGGGSGGTNAAARAGAGRKP